MADRSELDDLFRAFEAGELQEDDVGPSQALSPAERARLVAASSVVRSAVEAPHPAPELRVKVLAAVRAQAVPVDIYARSSVTDLPSARTRRRATWFGAAAVAAAVAVGAVVFSLRSSTPQAPVELAGATLRAASSAIAPRAEGHVEIFATATGERLTLEAEELPPTAPGQYYQVWFVALRDSRSVQRRVAIGAFRTSDGTVKAELSYSVDRTTYPTFAITLEPDDGDPRQNGQTIVKAVPVPESKTGGGAP